MGNDGEVFKLVDGSIWQVKYEYEYLYEYNPDVLVCPNQGKMIVDGKSLNIEAISHAESRNSKFSSNNQIIESKVEGDFEGFEGETIIQLVNGQVWQQSEYWYHYHYSFMPQVFIYNQGGIYKMKVDGVDQSVGVTRLRWCAAISSIAHCVNFKMVAAARGHFAGIWVGTLVSLWLGFSRWRAFASDSIGPEYVKTLW